MGPVPVTSCCSNSAAGANTFFVGVLAAVWRGILAASCRAFFSLTARIFCTRTSSCFIACRPGGCSACTGANKAAAARLTASSGRAPDSILALNPLSIPFDSFSLIHPAATARAATASTPPVSSSLGTSSTAAGVRAAGMGAASGGGVGFLAPRFSASSFILTCALCGSVAP